MLRCGGGRGLQAAQGCLGLEEQVSLEEAEGADSEAIGLAAPASRLCEKEGRGEERPNLSGRQDPQGNGWEQSTFKLEMGTLGAGTPLSLLTRTLWRRKTGWRRKEGDRSPEGQEISENHL